MALRDYINILIMTTGFDSKRIGILTFIHLGDPAPGSYHLQGIIFCMFIFKSLKLISLLTWHRIRVVPNKATIFALFPVNMFFHILGAINNTEYFTVWVVSEASRGRERPGRHPFSGDTFSILLPELH